MDRGAADFANRIVRPLDFSVYASLQVAGPRAEIAGTFADPSRWLKYIAAALIILLAAITRLPGPWRMDVTNEEMEDLESYRNHYRTDDISPDLLQKLERARVLTPEPNHTAIDFWRFLVVAGPLAGLHGIAPIWSNIGTVAFLVTIAIGIGDLLLCSDLSTPARWGLLTVPLVYVAAALVTWETRLR